VTVGFIGAGQLGEPMALRLLEAGHRVVVYVRNDEVRSRLEGRGAVSAPSVAAWAAESDIMISCLFSDKQLHEIGSGSGGFVANAKVGAVFVSHTTGEVGTLADLAAGSPSALEIVDAPVSGTAEDISRGTLTVLVGGESEVVERVRPYLAAYADTILATGPLGTALRIKLVNNVLFAANGQLVAAAVDIGTRLGIEPDRLLEAISLCSGASRAAEYVRGVGGLDAFGRGVAPFLRKDVAAALAAAGRAGADLGLLGAVIEDGPFALTEETDG
jgi:3-hydroxyisobutyrate dehydrogenase-like beta-hydroxyacid dehydrogenase